jgi:hypothetical protein
MDHTMASWDHGSIFVLLFIGSERVIRAFRVSKLEASGRLFLCRSGTEIYRRYE